MANDAVGVSGRPQVFIVTPTLNSEGYIDDCIHSVLRQQGDFDLHFHVQDGASTDGTVAKVRKWQTKLESGEADMGAASCILTVAAEPDNGIYDGIVKGFSSFAMDDDAVMAWINSDDILLHHAVERAVAALSMEGVDWVLGLQRVRNKHGEEIWRGDLPYPMEMIKAGLCDGVHWAHIQQEGTFWNYRLWSQAGGLDLSFRYAGDWDLWRRFSQYARPVQLRYAMGAFTSREGQVSIACQDEYEAEKERVISLAERRSRLETLLPEPQRFYFHRMIEENGTMEVKVEMIAPERVAAFKGRRATFDVNTPDGGACGERNYLFLSLWNLFVDAPALHRLYRKSPRGLQRLLTTVKYRCLVPLRTIRKTLPVFIKLHRSGLFFHEYYLQDNPDVRRSGMSPLWHYILHGSQEGRMPNPLFDDRWYRLRYPDVDATGINPLYHFLQHGWREGRDPGPSFSVSRYFECNPDVRESGCCPLAHYLVHGIAEGRSIE